MTKDEIKTRIQDCRAELDSLKSGTGESSEPALNAEERRKHLEKEVAALQAMLDEA